MIQVGSTKHFTGATRERQNRWTWVQHKTSVFFLIYDIQTICDKILSEFYFAE